MAKTTKNLRKRKGDRVKCRRIIWVGQSQAMKRHLIREDREVGIIEAGHTAIIGLRDAGG